ncbi:MAG: Coq4 family protein [Myxococcota bacterium]
MRTGSVVVDRKRLGPVGFVREVVRARRTGPEPETVFRLLRPFHGPQLDTIYDRVMADPTGRRLLREGHSLQPLLLDLPRLRALPDGTLGREYARFMDDNGIDIVSFAEASLRHMKRSDYANDETWTLVNRARDIHEIVHVVSGYGTDVLGEMCEIAFNIEDDPRPKAARFAIRVNAAMFRRHGYDHGDAAIAEAFERGAKMGLTVAVDWEALLEEPLDAVRAGLGIEPPRLYRPIPPPGEPEFGTPAFSDLLHAALA